MSAIGPEAEARIGVEVEDAAALARLRELDARFDAQMAALSRKEATIRIKGNLSDFSKDIAAAKAEIKALQTEQEKLSELRADKTGAEKGVLTRRINALNDEIKASQAVVAERQKALDAATKDFNILQRTNREADIAYQKQQAITAAKQRAADVDSRAAAQAARDRAKEQSDWQAMARMQSDAARMDQARYTADIGNRQKVIALQERQLATQQKINDLEAAAARAQGADKQRINLQTAGAVADYERMRRELEMMGEKPIVQKVEVKADESVFTKLRNALLGTGGGSDANGPASSSDGALTLMEKFKRTFSASMNVGPFNASVASVILSMGALAPAIMAVLGAAGSLVSVLGSGLAGAAGIGGAALTGLGMTAVGIMADIRPLMQQFQTIHSAMNTYQTAVMRYGPRSGATPSATAAQNRIPAIQAAIRADRARVAQDTSQYGAGAARTLSAQATLAREQSTLATTQTRAATGANQSQKAYEKLQSTLKQASPTVRDAVMQWMALAKTWHQMTDQNAKNNFGAMIDQAFKTAHSDVRFFATDTNQAFTAIRKGWTGWMMDLRSPDMKNALDNIFHNFALSITPAMDGLGKLGDALMRFFSTMSNYMPNIAHGFDSWATGIDNAAKATDGWAAKAPTMMHSLESIGHFAEAAVKWVYELLRPAVGPGQNFLNDMANSLDRSAKSMSTLQRQKSMGEYFQDSVRGTEQLWQALKPLVVVFGHLAAMFAPLATAMAPILAAFGKLAEVLTSASGPMGKILLDVTAFFVSARLVGQVTKMTSAFGALKGSLIPLMAAWKALTGEGALMTRVQAAGNAWKDAGAKSSGIARALVTGGEDAGKLIAEQMVAAGAEAGKIMAAEMSGGSVVGGGLGRAESSLARMEGGLVLPPGVTGVSAAEAESKGFMARARGLGGRLLRGAGYGLGVAGAGQLAGLAIGGRTGSQISSIGNYAGLGAGLGGMAGPEGALIGGAIGAVGGAILSFLNQHAGPDFGTRAGNRQARLYANTNLDPNTTALFQRDFARQSRIGANALAAYRSDVPHFQRGGPLHSSMVGDQAQATKDWNTWFNSMYKRGQDAGRQFAAMFDSVQFKTTPAFISDALLQLKNLRGEAKTEAAKTMIEYAAQLQQSGQLPKGSLAQVMKALEGTVKGLAPNLAQSAMTTSKDWAEALKMTEARSTLKASMMFVRSQFGMLNIDPNVNGSNWSKNMDTTIADLHQLMKSKLPQVRDEATRIMHQMRQQVGQELDAMTRKAVGDSANLSTAIQSNIQGAGSQVSQNFFTLQQNIHDAMNSGLVSAQTGSKMIAQALNAALKAFGSKPIPLNLELQHLASPSAHLRGMAGIRAVNGQIQMKAAGAATGARIPGASGPDDYMIVDRQGMPRARVAGGELVIANRHTENRVDSMLSHFGTSLSEQINHESMPHTAAPAPVPHHYGYSPFRAQGGRSNTGYSMYALPVPRRYLSGTWSPDQGIDIAMPAGTPEYAVGPGTIVQEGIQGFGPWAPILRVNAGPLSGNEFYYGHAGPNFVHKGAHVVAGQEITQVGAGRVGISTGPHIEFGFWPPRGGTAVAALLHALMSGSGVSQFGGAMALPTIDAPHVGGAGTMRSLVQAGLNKAASGANAYLQAHASGGLGSVGTLNGPVSRQIYQAFSRLGYNKTAIAGIIGNAAQESSLRPDIDSGGAAGLFQSTPPSKLFNFAAGIHQPWQSVGTQALWVNSLLGGGGRAQLNSQNSPASAATWFMQNFERPGIPALSNRIAAAQQAYKQGFSLGGIIRAATGHSPRRARPIRPTRTRRAHRDTSRTLHSPPTLTESMMEFKWQQQEAAAKKAFEDYNFTIHHKTHHPGHWVGTGKNRHYVHGTGGPTRNELHHLQELKNHYHNLLKEDPHWSSEKAARAALTSVLDIPPADRIGGIGTSDLDQAASDAQQEWQAAQSALGKHPSRAARANVNELHKIFVDLRNTDNSAKNYVQDFTNIENVIDNLGNYMDDAAGSADDMATGYDPGTGKSPQFPKRQVTKPWHFWQQRRNYWMTKHTSLLKRATRDARRAMTRHGHRLSRYDIQYLQQLTGAESQSLSDERANAAATDPAVAGGITIDQYIQGLGDTSQLAKLNYDLSLDQGAAAANPGSQTAFNREVTDTKALMDFYGGLLSGAQKNPRTATNYNLLQQLSDAFNSARSNYQALIAPSGPTQDQLASTAMSSMFQQYAGNVASIVPGGTFSPSALTAATVPFNPAAAADNSGGTGGANVTVHNYYQTQPTDPHSWSQGLAYELQAAI